MKEKFILAQDYLHPFGGLYVAGSVLLLEENYKKHQRFGRWFRFEGSEDYVGETVAKNYPEVFIYDSPEKPDHSPKFFGLIGMPGSFSFN